MEQTRAGGEHLGRSQGKRWKSSGPCDQKRLRLFCFVRLIDDVERRGLELLHFLMITSPSHGTPESLYAGYGLRSAIISKRLEPSLDLLRHKLAAFLQEVVIGGNFSVKHCGRNAVHFEICAKIPLLGNAAVLLLPSVALIE